MAKVHGKEGIVKVSTNAVGEVTEFTLTMTTDIARDDAMGDDWQTHLIGKRSATGSISCRFDPADTNGQVALEDGGDVALKLYPGGDTTGKREFTIAKATITNVALNASHEDVVSYSFDFTVNGAVAIANVSGGGGG